MKWLELIVLFIGIPLLLICNLPIAFKLSMVVLAIIYCGRLCVVEQLVNKPDLYQLGPSSFNRELLVRILVIAILLFGLMAFLAPEDFFKVLKKAPGFWLLIVGFYSIFSVYPQEFIYRLFFMKRYEALFPNSKILILANAALFSFAHIIFANQLVLLITFVGGILFAHTFLKTNSLMKVSVEHALYGSWIFTLGMGEMLAFPVG